MGACFLSGIRVGLKQFVEPLPPFADICTPGFYTLRFHPHTKSCPGSTDPAPNHAVEYMMVYDTFKDHASPHLAGAVYCEGGRQHFGVITNGVRIGVLGQAKDAPYR